jgi:hypothetical protein
VDYFLLEKDRIATTKLANAQAKISASKTVTASPPFNGAVPTTLEKPILLPIHYNITIRTYGLIFKKRRKSPKRGFLGLFKIGIPIIWYPISGIRNGY